MIDFTWNTRERSALILHCIETLILSFEIISHSIYFLLDPLTVFTIHYWSLINKGDRAVSPTEKLAADLTSTVRALGSGRWSPRLPEQTREWKEKQRVRQNLKSICGRKPLMTNSFGVLPSNKCNQSTQSTYSSLGRSSMSESAGTQRNGCINTAWGLPRCMGWELPGKRHLSCKAYTVPGLGSSVPIHDSMTPWLTTYEISSKEHQQDGSLGESEDFFLQEAVKIHKTWRWKEVGVWWEYKRLRLAPLEEHGKPTQHQLMGESWKQTLSDIIIRGCLNSKVMCSAINSSGGEVVGVAVLD